VSVVELLKVVGDGGAVALVALMLVGLFYLALRFIPQALHAIGGYTAALHALRETVIQRADAHDRKDDAIISEMQRVAVRQSEIAGDVATQEGIALGAALATGQHAAVTVERPPQPSRPDSDPSHRRNRTR
jgi:hypothetical protein